MIKFIRSLFKGKKQRCNIPAVRGGKSDRITQIQKHLENGDIKFYNPSLYESPNIIISYDFAVEGASDYTVTCYNTKNKCYEVSE